MTAAAPVRTCVGCRRRRPQADLVRLVVSAGGTLAAGRTLPGRGAWLCPDDDRCRAQAVRRNAFPRAFRRPVVDLSVLETLPSVGASEQGAALPTSADRA